MTKNNNVEVEEVIIFSNWMSIEITVCEYYQSSGFMVINYSIDEVLSMKSL